MALGQGFGYVDPTMMNTTKLNTDFMNPTPVVPQSPGFGTPLPALPVAPTAGAAPTAGMGAMNWAAILGQLSKAFAPQRYNRWGAKIPSWQEQLGGSVSQMSQAQLMAKALAAGPAGSGGTMSPQMMMLMMNNPAMLQLMGGGK
jgi:hypothetical protein